MLKNLTRVFSAFAANLVATMACVTTNLAGSAGGIVWSLLDYTRKGSFSAFSFCIGCICGLVSIVPSSGYVSPSSAVAIGAISSLVSYIAFVLKHRFFFDDVMDVFILNGISGCMASILAVSDTRYTPILPHLKTYVIVGDFRGKVLHAKRC